MGSESGFTLMELILAVFIFTMVMAGLSVITGTAFKQGIGLMEDTRQKGMANIAMRAIQMELSQATILEQPTWNDATGNGTAGRHLRGWTNVAWDATTDPTGPRVNMSGASSDRHWFHFCLRGLDQGDLPGVCELDTPKSPKTNVPGCLFYYKSRDGAPYGSAPSITNSSCGNPIGGVTPILLASGIQGDVASSTENIFTRRNADGVIEKNQVRADFRMMIPATHRHPSPIRYEVDSTFGVQYAPW